MSKKDLEKLRTEEFIAYDLELIKNEEKWKKYARIVANAMSGVPWVGSFVFSTGSAANADSVQGGANLLYEEWLKVHKEKIYHLLTALDEVTARIDSIDVDSQNRMESEEYLGLLRRAFKSWDNAETAEKQEYIVNLISNSATTSMCPDDLIRLFNDWLDQYHEIHFKVIRAIYQSPGITRMGIWRSVSGIVPRDDSAEADLFRLLIDDLSRGRVIRQHRQTTYDGRFVKETTKGKSKKSSSGTMVSAFDDIKQYELTELGSQFVHYTMNQVVKRIENS